MAAPPLYDAACVIHVHSRHSDGTGTVAEIAAAGARAGVDAILLTDHDTLAARRAGEERWHGPTLVCVGEEVSPKGANHYLAFGLDEPLVHAGLDAQGIVDAVAAAGGFGFLAHPFSRGSEHFARARGGIPWRDLDATGYTGLEVWSFLTDSVEALTGRRHALRFVADPARAVAGPPADNLATWDRLTRARPVVAIGGADAHQIGRRVAGRVVRLMGYARSFSLLRTHVLLERPFDGDGDADADRARIYAALRAGRCYVALDALAPARGFAFWAEGAASLPMGAEAVLTPGTVLRASAPRPARLVLVRDGEAIASADGTGLEHPVERPGVYRVEVALPFRGHDRTWILSNPIYLRPS